MSDWGEGLVAKLASFPYAVLTFIGDDGYPCSLPSRDRTVGFDGTVTIPIPRGLTISVGKEPSASVLFHTFDEEGGSQDYVLLLGEVSSSKGNFLFKSTKPLTRPPDGGKGEAFYKMRAEEYLTKVRPKTHPDDRNEVAPSA